MSEWFLREHDLGGGFTLRDFRLGPLDWRPPPVVK